VLGKLFANKLLRNYCYLCIHNILIKVVPNRFRDLRIVKKTEAVIPHVRLQMALSALDELNLGGLTYYESKGRGQLPRPKIQSGRGTYTYTPEFNANSTIVVVVKDSMVEQVVKKLLESTSTGLAGEGKIFISEINDAVDIGSRRRGEDII